MSERLRLQVLDKLAEQICVDKEWQNWKAFKKILNDETGEFFPTRQQLIERAVDLALLAAAEEVEKLNKEALNDKDRFGNRDQWGVYYSGYLDAIKELRNRLLSENSEAKKQAGEKK